MKLPNGYGSITKLKGKRRNPYVVRITTGKDQDGYLIRTVLGYYPSYTKASEALADFNRDPFDVTNQKLTFTDVYKAWVLTNEYQKLSASAKKQYGTAYNDYELLHLKSFCKIKIPDMQMCIDLCNSGYTARRFMKNLASKLYQYALRQEYVKENKAEHLQIGSPSTVQKEKVPYSDDEIDVLWKHKDDEIVKLILIYIYTGVRCNELLNLKKENLHLDDQWFDVIESKTKAGVRPVPIADVIVPLFRYFVGKSHCSYVFTTSDKGNTKYRDDWWRRKQKETLAALGMQHTTHEARHTCITQLTVHDVNPSVIKEIVGHKAAKSFTERVYTHVYMKTKIEAVNKIHTT
ncbi:MAG: tyrosine-type recombinase/integrase [Eubacterium sp.]|nr:tyrosine-type recombinase/integrase [Eubacterium sp.]